MRISDWSSDVCSSDLGDADPALGGIAPAQGRGDMPLGRRAIGEGSGLRLTARADPPPAGFDDDHAKEVEAGGDAVAPARSEEHTSELQSLMRNSYAVFCLQKKKHTTKTHHIHRHQQHR